MKFFKGLILAFLTVSLAGCDNGNPDPNVVDNFDRKAMLENWADNIIIPGYNSFAGHTSQLKKAGASFAAEPTQIQLDSLRTAFVNAYKAWQKVSMFTTGKSEEINLREYLNIYPVDVQDMLDNIEQGGYNLELPSEYDQQGFPALDYLLYGLGTSDDMILEKFINDAKAESFKNYLVELVDRIDMLTQEVTNDWNGTYRDEFVQNSGNSATASVDRMVNDFLFYYEKHLRAGKVGIPGGVFGGNFDTGLVEARFQDTLNKELLLIALDAVQDFFKGNAFQTGTEGLGLEDYLDALETKKDDTQLSELINNQFEAARAAIQGLNESFRAQIVVDVIAFLEAYDQLQLNVVLMKVDMMQALNINVDYVDADGD